MSKLREKLEEKASIHGGYNLAMSQIVSRLEDITDEVERYGAEITTAISQDLMKYTGKGTIQVKFLNLHRNLQKITKDTDEVLKATRKLK